MKPIAWYDPTNDVVSTDKDSPLFTPLGQVWPLYPQRAWVGLTDKEIEAIWEVAMFANYGVGAELSNQPFVHYARAIEAKLKDKNEQTKDT
jgi:hypothetical protein